MVKKKSVRQPRYGQRMVADANVVVLDKGKIDGYDYLILDLGVHPTAYVNLPKNHSHFNVGYDDLPVCVHGGLTYAHKTVRGSSKKGWWVGWDYAHSGDYSGYLPTNERKWTTEEIFEHVKSVIKQLRKLKVRHCNKCGHIIRMRDLV
jgi:hypothetical protein